MDDDLPGRVPVPARTADRLHEALVRDVCTVGLFASLLLVAVATLTPEGSGWEWGAPLVELRWYLAGFGSAATMLQLVGNLALLAAPAAFAVRRWPVLGRGALLVAVSLTAGTSIEAVQWALSLGRVVSPLDAILNAAGAVVAGWMVARLHRRSSAHPARWRAAVTGLRLPG